VFKIKTEETANEKVIQLRINLKEWAFIQELEKKSGVKWQSIIRQMIQHCTEPQRSK